ncbi:MAG: amidohydrolase family protein [bacterium]
MAILMWCVSPVLADDSSSPIADIHLHWKWNQKEITTPEQAVALLRENQVELAVVMGTPPELALELKQLAPEIVIPIYSLYRIPGEWSEWHRDDTMLTRARKALQSGQYHGLGEVHLIGGFISDWKNPVISGLFELAAEFDVPVLVHTEFSRADYTLGFCQAHPDTRFLWAHAGSILSVTEVERVLKACPNMWVELSARDPWRHQIRPISSDGKKLVPEWQELVIRYSDRFMVGSDTVWPVEQLNPWDEPDSGWQELNRFLDFHRSWLQHLPQQEQQQIRLLNARAFFGRASR